MMQSILRRTPPYYVYWQRVVRIPTARWGLRHKSGSRKAVFPLAQRSRFESSSYKTVRHSSRDASYATTTHTPGPVKRQLIRWTRLGGREGGGRGVLNSTCYTLLASKASQRGEACCRRIAFRVSTSSMSHGMMYGGEKSNSVSPRARSRLGPTSVAQTRRKHEGR